MKTFALATLLFLTLSHASAQTTPLSGKVIGTAQSVDYSTQQPSDSINSIYNAFDGDTGTFFASYARSNTWVGLDLGEKHVITKVAYAPRTGYAQRMVLGVFEGANNPDFSDAIPLYMITSAPEENQLTSKFPKVTQGFRYVRYIGPNDARCNVAELLFYGIKGDGSDTRYYQPTNLPLVTVHTDSAKNIDSKTQYIPGTISIVSADGKEIYSDTLDIRGRGNASWLLPKKSYKIKLRHKKKLLGMPAKAKKWTLIANYGDKTLVRNMLAFHISRCMGLEYTPAARLVDLMVNGEYLGTYQLCDQIEVRKNRVDITEMDTLDNSTPEITGGYLVEVDAYANQERKWFTTTNFKLPVSIKYPDEDDITSEQANYVQTYFNRMVSRVNSSLYNDPKLGFRRYLDEESFLRRLLVEELAANSDALWSVHMYKDRDSTKFYTGPVWDFDLAFENDIRVHPVTNLDDDFLFTYSNTTSAGNMRDFTRKIADVSAEKLKELWSIARYDNGLTPDSISAFLDSMQAEVYASQKLNFLRWPIMNQIVNQNYQITGSYEGEMKVVRDFMDYRIAWLDQKVGLTPVGISGTRATASHIRPLGSALEISITSSGGTATVEIFDLSGTLVKQSHIERGKTLISLPKGLYFVKLSESGATTRKKILIR